LLEHQHCQDAESLSAFREWINVNLERNDLSGLVIVVKDIFYGPALQK
jgi:hypothetical protein